jgi:hypothetical protein
LNFWPWACRPRHLTGARSHTAAVSNEAPTAPAAAGIGGGHGGRRAAVATFAAKR